jgi:hypothetical protein
VLTAPNQFFSEENMPKVEAAEHVREVSIPLNRDVFLRNLIRELSGTLEDVVGLSEASGFISVVGQTIGDQINHDYKVALGSERLSRQQLAEVLVDLKRRIQGDFYIIEESDSKIVLGNRACPFAEKVITNILAPEKRMIRPIPRLPSYPKSRNRFSPPPRLNKATNLANHHCIPRRSQTFQ